MDEKRYGKAIENASDILIDAMLEDVDELVEEGRQLDAKVREVLFEVGARMMVRLFAVLGAVLVEEAKRKGLTIERRPTVTFKTIYGPIEVESAYLRNVETGESTRPMREHLGVEGERYSDAVDRAVSDFGAENSYQKSTDRFFEHYGWQMGRTTVRSRTMAVAEAAQAYVEERFSQSQKAYQEPTATRKVAQEMLVETDGCHIRCGELMTAKQAREICEDEAQLARLEQVEDDKVVRLEQWKEVRTGLARRPGQVEPTYVCRRGSWDEVTQQLFAAACEHGLGFETQVIAPGDGGIGLKEALEVWFPHLQFILDRPHLKSHVHECAQLLSDVDELDQPADTWVSEVMDTIHEGHVDKVLAENQDRHVQMEKAVEALEDDSQEASACERLGQFIKHLQRFYHCVDYQAYEDKDWPIGSGEVESAHKTVPQGRLKKPGACWKEENLNPMCALRALRANGWWDDFWAWENERRRAA
jgi:hypothetical protein